MSDMRQKLLPVFLEEAGRKIAQLETFFAAGGGDGQSLDELEVAFRAAHTLKGTAALVQADSVCALSARLEGLLEGHFEQRRFPSVVEYEAMRLALDRLRQLVGAIARGEAEPSGKASEAEVALRLAATMPGNRRLGELLEQKEDDPFAEDPQLGGENHIRVIPSAFALPADPFGEDPDPLAAALASSTLAEPFGDESELALETDAGTVAGSLPDPFADDPDPESEVAAGLFPGSTPDPFGDDPAAEPIEEQGAGLSAPAADLPEPRVAIPADPFAEDPEPETAAPVDDAAEAFLEASFAELVDDPFAADPELDYPPDHSSVDVNDAATRDPLRGEKPQESFAERLRRRLEQENVIGTAERLAATLLTHKRGEASERQYTCCQFRVAGKDYHLPIANMVEIADLPRVIRLPLAPPIVRGLINLRGQVIPLIDLGALGAEVAPYVALRKLVIAEASGERLAFLADGIPNLSETTTGEKVDVKRFVEQFRAGAS